MAKQKSKTDEVTEITDPNLTLDSVAYSIVKANGEYQFVKFNFDVATKTMSEIEVVASGSVYDMINELIVDAEDEIYNS